jgi:hypothetical protein
MAGSGPGHPRLLRVVVEHLARRLRRCLHMRVRVADAHRRRLVLHVLRRAALHVRWRAETRLAMGMTGGDARVHRRVHRHPRLLPLGLASHSTAVLPCAELRVRLHVLRVVLHLTGGRARLHLLGLVGDHSTHAVLVVRHKLGAIRSVQLRLTRRAVLL